MTAVISIVWLDALELDPITHRSYQRKAIVVVARVSRPLALCAVGIHLGTALFVPKI